VARPLVLLGAAVVGAAILLVVLLRSDDAPSRAPAADVSAGSGGGPATGDGAATEAVSPPEATPHPPDNPPATGEPSRPRIPARDREQAIRQRLTEVLRATPEVHTTDIRCTDDRHCRVELEAPDLERASPVLERLSAPGTGFAGEAKQLRLEAPVALGQDAGPWRLAFNLEF